MSPTKRNHRPDAVSHESGPLGLPMIAYYSEPVRHPVLGELGPTYGDPEMGFRHFRVGEIVGLAKVLGDRIEVLAAVSLRPRCGNFSSFVEELRGAYREVVFWEVMDARVDRSLRRQGFVTVLCPDGAGLAWRRPA